MFVKLVASNRARKDFVQTVKQRLFAAILRQDQAYFERYGAGRARGTLDGDCNRVAQNFLRLPMQIIAHVSSASATAGLLYVKAPAMLRRAALFGLAAAVPIIALQRAVNRINRKNDRVLRETGRETGEILGKLATVREYAREDQSLTDYARVERYMRSMEMSRDLCRTVQGPIIRTFFHAAFLYNLWHGARMVNLGELRAFDLVQLSGYSINITNRIKEIINLVPQLFEIMLPVERIFDLLETKSLIEPMDGDAKAPFEPTRGGGVEFVFEDVSFAYPTMPEHNVLRHLDLVIPAGKTVALVGERGCGKSTAIALLLRKFDPEMGMGRVLVNGRMFQEWDVRQFRRAVSVVSQQVSVFSLSIRENLLYGLDDRARLARGFEGPDKKTKGDAELQEVLEKAAAWDFVKDFPMRLETRLGDGSVKLSGGQTQCLAIARALVKKPACLLLDEATSALDAKTQKSVAANIAAEQRALGFTIVQIAHRLETLTSSDVVYFMQHGRVLESGGADSLAGKACDELLARPVVMHTVEDPESGKPKRQIKAGHFKNLWNTAHDVTDMKEWSREKLAKRVKELEEEKAKASATLRVKQNARRASIKLRAVARIIGQQHFAEAASVDYEHHVPPDVHIELEHGFSEHDDSDEPHSGKRE